MSEKVAVILFNLGAPDSMQAVRPFLFNLFADKNIIRLPYLLRMFLAYVISKKRSETAKEIYKILGGKSPLLENTQKQANLLEKKLNKNKNAFKCFISMRYWHPMAKKTAKDVQEFQPDKIVLLPLYPQYSTTTTRSSFEEWDKYAKTYGLTQPSYKLCCYPDNQGFIDGVADLLQKELQKIKNFEEWRILFSAHGLPKNIVEKGDPYASQIEKTAESIVKKVKKLPDWFVCYQSRVGPLEWIKPYTEDEIMRAGKDKKSLIVVPIAFVSEHSETLVELDCEYKGLAEEHYVKNYVRIATVSENEKFINGLETEVDKLLIEQKLLNHSCSGFTCEKNHKDCPHQ